MTGARHDATRLGGAGGDHAPAEPLIRLAGVSRVYDQAGQRVAALDNVSLDIAHGEFVAVQGPSGSGKSTLLHVLGLLDRPSQGRYLLAGEDVSGMDDDQLSGLRNRRIGFVFQSFYLIPYASALDNVLLPGLYSAAPAGPLRDRARELLDLVGLSDRLHFMPSQLSGGQQQRVALARALVNAPDLVLADEPTGQLDTVTGGEIMDLIARINAAGTTIIVVTHDAATAAHARRTILMRDGRPA
ncbi:MAG: ABC transporter ATP-binding protein [Desulfovibrionaceae bacterium]